MPIPIEMPKLSDTMTEGTLVKWLKKEGDAVEVGDVIAEIETDKATMEMEVFDDGTLHKFFAKEGDKIAVGGKLAILLEEGEEAPSDAELESAGSKGEEAKKTEVAEASGKEEAEAAAAARSEFVAVVRHGPLPGWRPGKGFPACQEGRRRKGR